jgi:hypothetical protein
MIYDKKLMIGAKSKSGVELDAEKAIFKFVCFAKQQVAEEDYQVADVGVNAFGHIAIIGTDQSVAEVPRVLFKHIVLHLHSDCAQILYGKDCGGASIAFGKWMYLPQPDYECGKMLD